MRKIVQPQHEALLVEAGASNRREVVAAILKMLEEDRRLAYRTGQPAVAVSASVAIAKLLNLFEARPELEEMVVVAVDEEPRMPARRIALALTLGGPAEGNG